MASWALAALFCPSVRPAPFISRQGNPVAAETDMDMLSRVMGENLATSLASNHQIEAGMLTVTPFFKICIYLCECVRFLSGPSISQKYECH